MTSFQHTINDTFRVFAKSSQLDFHQGRAHRPGHSALMVTPKGAGFPAQGPLGKANTPCFGGVIAAFPQTD